MTWTAPWLLNRLTLPSAPTLATTRLGTSWLGTTLRLEALGRGAPVGNTVSQVDAEASVAVTFITTAATPEAGTPPTPVTVTAAVSWLPTLAGWPPTAVRVSRMRAGVRAVKEGERGGRWRLGFEARSRHTRPDLA